MTRKKINICLVETHFSEYFYLYLTDKLMWNPQMQGPGRCYRVYLFPDTITDQNLLRT